MIKPGTRGRAQLVVSAREPGPVEPRSRAAEDRAPGP